MFFIIAIINNIVVIIIMTNIMKLNVTAIVQWLNLSRSGCLSVPRKTSQSYTDFR